MCFVVICPAVWWCVCSRSCIVWSVWIFPSVWWRVSRCIAALGGLGGNGASNMLGFTGVTRGREELTLGGCLWFGWCRQ